ncbi:MAG: hypothetical protein ACRDZV_00155 [Acidimicrobiia bacterium]
MARHDSAAAKARRRAQDRALRAEARRARRAESRVGAVRHRLGWPLCALGVVLLLSGMLGALTGTQILPFDSHHLLSQIGGGVLTVTGLVWATS